MNKKSFFVNAGGENIRSISKECVQTFFVLTKDPVDGCRELSKEEVDYFLNLKKEDFTFSNLVSWLGNTVDIRDDDKHKKANHSKFNYNDYFTLTSKDYPLIKGTDPVKTTLGRLIFNRVMIEFLDFNGIFEYQNCIMDKKGYKKFDKTIVHALTTDKITTAQMIKFIDTRDWFGLQLHGVITTSFTATVMKVPPKTKELKEKLLKENDEAIKKGDTRVVEDIENKLIKSAMDEMKGDIGLDLYTSGARGSVDNHLKNMLLMRGAIQNPQTKEYEIITNSLMDGLEKKDVSTHSNMIISGAFPKAVKGCGCL